MLLEDSEAGPAGSVYHLKPPADANRRPVRCRLYRELSAEDFAALHEKEPTVMIEGGAWTLHENEATPEYMAQWLAGQFQSVEQLRGFLDLHREERAACFPSATMLADLDEAGWLQLGRRALQELETRRATKGEN